MSKEYQPLIIIGAARSGTKILRDIIAQHPDVDKVPFDINYIWRLGNEQVPHDALQAEQLTPSIQKRIKLNIQRFHKGAPILIEKTVSNCLRVPFVSAVYPQAKFIHLIRHGEDVVESAYRQWTAPPDWRYIVEKARTFPLLETPGYALRYIQDTIQRITKKEKVSAIWGPAYPGIQDDLRTLDLWQVCAIQWTKSVEKAFQGFSDIDTNKVLLIRYEDFVQSPESWLKKISNFLFIDSSIYQNRAILDQIIPHNVGKSQQAMTHQQKDMVRDYLQVGMTMSKYVFRE